jgi:hypothetical protein
MRVKKAKGNEQVRQQLLDNLRREVRNAEQALDDFRKELQERVRVAAIRLVVLAREIAVPGCTQLSRDADEDLDIGSSLRVFDLAVRRVENARTNYEYQLRLMGKTP